MAYHNRHVIGDAKKIADWQRHQHLVAASGTDRHGIKKRLLLDATTDTTFWVVETVNEKGDWYITLTTKNLNEAVTYYDEL
jgi:hypothetical protein